MLMSPVQLDLLLKRGNRPRGAVGPNMEAGLLQDNATNIVPIVPVRDITDEDAIFFNGDDARIAEIFVDTLVKKGKRGHRFAKIIDVTPALARALLNRNTRNRPTVNAAVDEYAELMKLGHWRLTIEAIGVDRTGVLANGQHRLKAVIKSGTTCPFTIWFGIEQDEFEVIDQGRKRTSAHLLHIANVPGGALRASIARILLMTSEWKNKTVPNQIIAEYVLGLGNALDRPNYWGMKFQHAKVTNGTSMGVAAYKLAAAGIPRQAIDDFFEPIVLGRGLDDLRARLRNALMVDKLKGPSDPILTVKRAAAVINTWNAYRKGNKRAELSWGHVLSLPEVRK